MSPLAGTFRSNPNYAIRPYGRIAHTVRAGPTGRDGAAAFGLLLPRGGTGLPTVEICGETALLFYSLQEAGPLPAFLVDGAEPAGTDRIVKLVLDRILEVEADDGFVSGPAAMSFLGTDGHRPHGRLAELSYRALRHAQELDEEDGAALTARLYCYNTCPIRAGLPRLDNEASTSDFLGLHGPQGRRFAGDWQRSNASEDWIFFRRHEPGPTTAVPAFKIYVSPRLDCLPDAFVEIAGALAASGAHSFKVGIGRRGLLRPDKIVAYLNGKDGLALCAARLVEACEALEPQGVPFTAEVGSDGLVSWGRDPEPSSSTTQGSWRLWVTATLSTGLIAARTGAQAGIEPWRFALERLRLSGVDPGTFAPQQSWSAGWP